MIVLDGLSGSRRGRRGKRQSRGLVGDSERVGGYLSGSGTPIMVANEDEEDDDEEVAPPAPAKVAPALPPQAQAPMVAAPVSAVAVPVVAAAPAPIAAPAAASAEGGYSFSETPPPASQVFKAGPDMTPAALPTGEAAAAPAAETVQATQATTSTIIRSLPTFLQGKPGLVTLGALGSAAVIGLLVLKRSL